MLVFDTVPAACSRWAERRTSGRNQVRVKAKHALLSRNTSFVQQYFCYFLLRPAFPLKTFSSVLWLLILDTAVVFLKDCLFLTGF